MVVVKRSLNLVIVFLITVSLSSCSLVRQVTGEEQPLGMSSTGLGAATGAVVGAGVGAIIGSTSGDLGIGTAVGGIAGAALGGALGQQEEREKNTKTEQTAHADQTDELLKANQTRINEYKKGTDINPSSRGALAGPNTYAKSSYVNTPSGYRGSPRAVSFAGYSSDSEFDTTPENVAPRRAIPKSVAVPRVVESPQPMPKTMPPIAAVPPAENTTATKVIPKTAQVDLFPEVQATTSVTDPILPKANSLEPVTQVPKEVAKSETNQVTATNGIVGIPVQPNSNKVNADPISEEIKTTVITGSKTGKAVSDDDCTRADQEYQRATTSISDADKLFYLRRALRLCPAKPNLHLATGRVYTKLGRVEDAEYEFRQVLDLEPKNTEAPKELASLKQGSK